MKPRRDLPLIGITPDVGGERSRATPRPGNKAEPLIVLQERYSRAVQEAGAVPLVLPILPALASMRRAIESLDGLIVSGGNFDINPKLYGEEPIKGMRNIVEERTRFELGLIDLALERDMPILGVCGGAQAINVALGGSLYQDIKSQVAGAAQHERGSLKESGGHLVTIVKGTKLRKIVGRESLEVNTTHHQAVKKLGKGLIVNAAAEDQVVEGIESRKHTFVLGVQWHPEFLVQRDQAQRKIFSALVSACRSGGR
ncbi:MAG TPA: gamma-glutamyl-gamma-aminobutyrate hydrolase family protein [Candidatus Binatia bacterium]